MKKISFIAIFLLQLFAISAQVKHDYNWEFGSGSDTGNTVNSGMSMSFNTSPISISSMWRDIDIWGINATMSDAEGNLLFYSNGCKVFNADHVLMENGNNINAGEVNDIQCPDDQVSGALNSGSNGMLALPDPGSDSLYYLFHQRLIYLVPFEVKIDRLLYSVINMNADNGKGIIVEKDITIIPDTLWRGNLTAVRHSNGVDWWIVNFQDLSDTCYTILLTGDTLLGPYKQQIGLAPTGGSDSGRSCFSPDGSKYASYNKIDQVYLYDFDRSNGQFSNFQQIVLTDTVNSGSVAFSPNSRFLYVATLRRLFQLDMWESDVAGSKILIDIYDGFQDPFPIFIRNMQLGPDCRIYIGAASSHYWWGIINRPDEPGLACDFRQHSFKLPNTNFAAMPYFPNYRLSAEPTYPCDSTIVVNLTTSTTAIPQAKTSVKLYPNPIKVGSVLTIELQKEVNGKLLIYDLLGQLVFSQELIAGGAIAEVVLPNGVEAGIYFWILKGDDEEAASGKVVVE